MRIGSVPISRIVLPRYHYVDIVRQLCGPNLIGYWPLNEQAGSVAADLSGNGRNGAYTGVTLGQPGIGDGFTAPLFDGITSFCDIYSAALAAVFNGSEGTLLVWARVSGAGVWPGPEKVIIALSADANNQIYIEHATVANQLRFGYNAGAGANNLIINADGQTSTDWRCYALTWSKSANQIIAYLNGAAVAAPTSGLGDWTGALSSTGCTIGAYTTTPLVPWSGLLSHAVLCNRALSPDEIATLSRVQ